MNTHFKNVQSLEELRRQYKDLLKKYHPDNKDGSTKACQEINAEYDKLFKILKDRHESAASSAQSAYKYDFNAESDKAIRDILQKIIKFTNATIEVCGSWVWVFNSYEYRAELKNLGFKFASKKKAWYWHGEEYQKKSHKSLSMDRIRDLYGSVSVETERTLKLQQA